MERLMEALPTINAKQKKLRINFQLKQLFFATFFCFVFVPIILFIF